MTPSLSAITDMTRGREVLAPAGFAVTACSPSAEPPAASHRSALRPTGAVPRKGHHVFTEAECWPDDPDYETWLMENDDGNRR